MNPNYYSLHVACAPGLTTVPKLQMLLCNMADDPGATAIVHSVFGPETEDTSETRLRMLLVFQSAPVSGRHRVMSREDCRVTQLVSWASLPSPWLSIGQTQGDRRQSRREGIQRGQHLSRRICLVGGVVGQSSRAINVWVGRHGTGAKVSCIPPWYGMGS